jgi:hypothetical protein
VILSRDRISTSDDLPVAILVILISPATPSPNTNAFLEKPDEGLKKAMK